MTLYKNPSYQELYSRNRISKKLRMFSHLLFLASSVASVFVVPSSALPSPVNPNFSSLSQSAGFETLILNSTSLQDPASLAASYTPECTIAYGHNLDHASCNNALSKISQDTRPLTFGERRTGTWDVILPHRYLSGTSVRRFVMNGLIFPI